MLRVLALSGGYSRDEACALLVHDHAMIASFSRALLEGLTDGQTDDQFNARLNASIAQIYQASVHKAVTCGRLFPFSGAGFRNSGLRSAGALARG